MVATVGAVSMDDEIRVAKLARLRRLQVRAAQQGYETTPAVANEIQDILVWLGESAPGLVNAQGAQLSASAPAFDAISEADRYQSLFRGLMLVSGRCEETHRKVDQLFWLLPAMLFSFFILSFVLEHLR